MEKQWDLSTCITQPEDWEWPTWDERAFWERRRQVKARGYPRGWTENEPEDHWVPEGKRLVILSRVDATE